MTPRTDRGARDPEKERGSAEPMPGRCGAHLRGTDPARYCLLFPTPGGNRCKRFHGGAAPQVQAAAGRRLAESQVRRSLDEVGIREVENPLEELRAITSEAVAFKDWAATHVASLQDRIRFTDDKGSEQLRAEVAVYERAMDRAAKLAEMWARLGLDAMLAALRVRVSEQQTEAMVRGVNAGLATLDLDTAARDRFLAAVAKELRP